MSTVLEPDVFQPSQFITQRFVTPGASVVEMGSVRSCRVFAGIDVRTSRYVDPNGEAVAFAEIARSPAAGLWRIGAPHEAEAPPADGAEHDIRIVLKYPVDTLHMNIGDRSVSLTDDLDPAGDSATLSPASRILLEQALRGEHPVHIVGTSRDTGRTIHDALVALNARDLEACEAFDAQEEAFSQIDASILQAPASPVGFIPPADTVDAVFADGTGLFPELIFPAPAGERPHHGPISVFYDERLPGAPDPDKIIGCRMTDLGGEIERYRVTQVSGFVSQSSEAWITRDAFGEVRQVYIPGVFEALRTPGTDNWTADVSIAAFANDPFEEPTYKGCLGSQSIEMTGAPNALSETLVPRPGLGADAPFPVARGGSTGGTGTGSSFPGMAVSFGGGGSSSSTPLTNSVVSTVPQSGSNPPVIVSGGSTEDDRLISSDPGQGGGNNGEPPSPGEPPNPEVNAVPLPFGFVLLLSGLGGLLFLRRTA